MKKKLTILLILFLLTSEVITLSLIFKKEDNTILEDIEITNKFNNKKQIISIKVENDDDYEYHDYEDKTKWPDKTKYTYAGSLCTDWGGNTITESIIKFDEVNYKATITTKKTAYCTLYFTKGKKTMDHLKTKGGSYFNYSSAVFGLYRFKGTNSQVLNNYICFGTTDIPTCTGSDKQYYMYRIIGVTDNSTTNTTLGLEDNQLKIIRAYPSSTAQKWDSNYRTNILWDDTDVVRYLNETYLSVEKVKWKNTYWEGIIDEPYWYIGDNTNQNATSETTTKSSKVHKIGLMYKSDFANAGPVGNPTGKTNWLFITNGMSGNPLKDEHTMTKNGGSYNAGYSMWVVESNGGLGPWSVTDLLAVRPVYYLIPNVTLAGEGTETSPFIITSKN